MRPEKPVTDLKKDLESGAHVGQQAPERRSTLLDDDFPPGPLPLNLRTTAGSPSPAQSLNWMHHPTAQPMVTRRLQHLVEELQQQDPHAATQLSNARTPEEFLSAVCGLFNLSRALSLCQQPLPNRAGLADTITCYLNRNLHTGPTLKTLAQFLGYSEKYCSDLFRSTIGESFSCYLTRRRREQAISLLMTTEKSIAEIASILGFSDPFTFSHFFKRTTGQSPRTFRTTQTRSYPHRSPCPPHKTFSPF